MISFEFVTATRVIFGAGKLSELAMQTSPEHGRRVEGSGKRPLLVCGRSSDAIPRVRQMLTAQDLQWTEFQVRGEPTIDMARQGVRVAREHACDMVIGLGGGSVLDGGKAIAALVANPGDVLDYLEVVGKGQALVNAPLPYFAIPTTAGTGTEVTRNAVLESPEHQMKVSLRSAWMPPRVALVDPELTYNLPPAVTASSGLDALTQLIEPFVSVKANPMTDAICREGIRHAAHSLRRAYMDGADHSAREGMALASLFGGLALTNAALGAVHGFASPLGGMLHRGESFAPHGAICARLLPLVMEANLKALQARASEHPAVARYAEIAQIMTDDKNGTALDGVTWVSELVHALNIPALSAYGMSEADIPEAVGKTLKASSYKGNPIALNADELTDILESAL